ncbi:MAG: hypothetical protein EOM80_10110, partial [Erysipelotrichia bacterium]|nr:hypothetical protein [Erysipelotrichia bacterium]
MFVNQRKKILRSLNVGNKFAWLVFFVFVSAFALIGCGGGGGSANPVGPVSVAQTATLSGSVLLDGQPVANANVYLRSSEKALQAGVSGLSSLRGSILAQTKLADGSYFTRTDSSGLYVFNDIPVGEYTLIAVMDENHQYAQPGILLGSVTTADAMLTPTGKISGRVQLNTNQPVPGAIVYLEKTSYVAISDANGDFILNNVPAGQTFSLQVLSGMGNLPNSYSLSIQPAEDRQLGAITLAAPSQQTTTINGSITQADSSVPVEALNGKIVLLTSTDPYPMVALSDTAGQFAFSVKTIGTYNVSVVGGEYTVSPTSQAVNANTLGTSINLSQPFVLTKPVVVLPTTAQYTISGTALKNTFINGETNHAGVTVAMTPTSGAASTYTGITDAVGSFSISVPAGTYNLSIISSSYKPATALPTPVTVTGNTALT